jgi:hypothetical protein
MRPKVTTPSVCRLVGGASSVLENTDVSLVPIGKGPKKKPKYSYCEPGSAKKGFVFMTMEEAARRMGKINANRPWRAVEFYPDSNGTCVMQASWEPGDWEVTLSVHLESGEGRFIERHNKSRNRLDLAGLDMNSDVSWQEVEDRLKSMESDFSGGKDA